MKRSDSSCEDSAISVSSAVVLGIAAYITRVASPNDPQPLNPMVGITVAHVACGALVFATTIILTLRTFKVLRGSAALLNLRLRNGLEV